MSASTPRRTRERGSLPDTVPSLCGLPSRSRALLVSLVLLAQSSPRGGTSTPSYDPLRCTDPPTPAVRDLEFSDAARGRTIPIRAYLPAAHGAAPVVLFSHGLGGSREGSAYLGRHWALRGYVAVFLQHPGSDEAVWKDRPRSERMPALKRAASPENLLLRVGDVSVVLDRLDAWNRTPGHPLHDRLDLSRVGVSGHSFGAVTAQAVGGQRAQQGDRSLADPRIRAACLLSPSGPRGGGDPVRAFGAVKIPWMLMTGTRDVAPIGDANVASRLAVFPALPTGGKYELVLEGAEHSAFTDRALPGDRTRRNPNHHRVVLALSTAFWDAWLAQDEAARAWLDGDGPRSLLEPGDRWKKK